MSRPPFLDALLRSALVFDGAMGTALYERGMRYDQCLDAANLRSPELPRAVHLAYRTAGADVLCTNTFGANRYRLLPHGLAGDLEAINRAGVALAREAAGEAAYVLGTVGPTGSLLETVDAEARVQMREAFAEQVAVLNDAGVDGLVLETFRQPEELGLAVAGAREAAGAALPIVACVSFDADGTTANGMGPEEVARVLVALGADAIGVNCSDGPAGVYEMCTRMLDAGKPVVAIPNAGLPRRVDGRLAYLATPEYFLLYAKRLYKAGVRGVGGCCGTTAAHIEQVAAAARMVGGGVMTQVEGGGGMREGAMTRRIAPGIEVIPREEKAPIGPLLGKRFITSVEVNPPAGLSLDKAIEAARMLRAGGIDMINVADGPRASARMGNLALCMRVQEQVGMPALMHVTTRDTNLLGLVAHLLAAHELGVKNLVVITGDPPKMGDFPDASAVYDLDSIGLLRMISGLNRGFDPGGKPLSEATAFLSATGAEPAARDYKRELSRLEQKIEAGAEMIMTQPVYDPAVLERFLRDVAPFRVPVLIGLLPLASYRNAEFLHNEVPGMSVPDAIRERMRRAGGGEAGRAEGVLIAREMLQSVRDRVDGAYIMPPFGRHELALAVVEGLLD